MNQGAQWAAATTAAKQQTGVTMALFFVPINMFSTTACTENISRGTELYFLTLL
jgi:hypothetical protein